ncbi:MAG: HD domain-containing protein, partial [Cyanobacteria bacterium P01_D01_bin.73]
EILSKGPGVTDREMLQAAVLHDVVEDTTCSIGEIESRYGQGVANKVDWLTKSPPREGMSKQQIKDEYFERLVSAPEDVITIKLADRLSNVQKLDTHPRPKKQRSYYLETLERILPLARNIDWFSQKFEEWRQHFSYLELEEV